MNKEIAISEILQMYFDDLSCDTCSRFNGEGCIDNYQCIHSYWSIDKKFSDMVSDAILEELGRDYEN